MTDMTDMKALPPEPELEQARRYVHNSASKGEPVEKLEHDLKVLIHALTVRSIRLRERIGILEKHLGINTPDEQSNTSSAARRLPSQTSVRTNGNKRKVTFGDNRLSKQQKLSADQISASYRRQQHHGFWQGLTPYFNDISQKDVDQVCEPNCQDAERSIPPIGPHYSVKWAMDDERSNNASRDATPSGGLSLTEPSSLSATNDTDGIWLAGVHPAFAALPPLMRRLLDALAEKNIVSRSWRRDTASSTPKSDNATSTALNEDQQIYAENSENESLGTRIISSLSGVLTRSVSVLRRQDSNADAQDEVLRELKQAQILFQAQAKVNQRHKDRIQRLSVLAMQEQKCRKRLHDTNAAVHAAFDAVRQHGDGAEVLARRALDSRKEALEAWKNSVSILNESARAEMNNTRVL